MSCDDTSTTTGTEGETTTASSESTEATSTLELNATETTNGTTTAPVSETTQNTTTTEILTTPAKAENPKRDVSESKMRISAKKEKDQKDPCSICKHGDCVQIYPSRNDMSKVDCHCNLFYKGPTCEIPITFPFFTVFVQLTAGFLFSMFFCFMNGPFLAKKKKVFKIGNSDRRFVDLMRERDEDLARKSTKRLKTYDDALKELIALDEKRESKKKNRKHSKSTDKKGRKQKKKEKKQKQKEEEELTEILNATVMTELLGEQSKKGDHKL